MSKLKNISVLMEITLVFPFNLSFGTLIEFTNVWNCKIIKGGTLKNKALIEMPWGKFKFLWKKNPRKGDLNILSGMESFIRNIRVVEIKIL